MDILEEIVARKRVDLEQMKARYTERTIHQEVEQLMQQGIAVPSMSQALKSSQTGIIAEFKRRSPSKGWIKEMPILHRFHWAINRLEPRL